MTKLINSFYIPCNNHQEAKKIGKKLLEEKLVACINILKEVDSAYWWKGTIEESKEAVLIAKTLEELSAKVTNKVKELHLADCPAIIKYDVTVNNEYYDWLKSSLK